MRGAPHNGVLLAHSSNEIAQLRLDRGFSWPSLGFPAPVGPEPRSMPGMVAGCTTRAKGSQSRVIQTIRALTPPQPQTLRWSSQGNVKLMTEKEVLNFKPTPGLEKICNKHCKQADDREHRLG